MDMIRAEQLSYTFSGASCPILHDLTFSVKQGEMALLYGPSGCGKTTLLRLLKPELTATGKRQGRLLLLGREEGERERQDAFRIGYVGQDPHLQIVTDRVWHEIAFGAERMGMDGDEMKRRVAELCCYLGLEEQYLRSTATLSGGQAQIVNLAAALVTDPELLILDEPTAQLDPTAAERFLSLLMRLQRQSGMTVLMAEHRLDGLIGQADRMLVLLEGRLIGDGRPSEVLPSLSRHPRLHLGLPAAARLSMELAPSEPPALDVAAFRRRFADITPLRPLPPRERQDALGEALSLRGVSFAYEKDRPVLSGLSLSLSYGQTLCLMGGNGSGKSTLLSLACGLIAPSAGKLMLEGKPYRPSSPLPAERRPAMLVQDVSCLFSRETVEQELIDVGLTPDSLPIPISLPPSRHPYDLSGGEKQLLGLCLLLSIKTRILLLDEPTKGLDRFASPLVAEQIELLRRRGYAILCVTHDREFAASVATHAALLFRGEVVGLDTAERFFRSSRFYTTATRLLLRDRMEDCLTAEQALWRLGKEEP